MRRIGTLSDEAQARRFGDYLLTRDIASRVESDGDGWAVWIVEEDDVEPAREELARFQAQPEDPRYVEAAAEAERRRAEIIKQHREAARRTVDVRQRWERPWPKRCPVTFILMVACLVVAALTQLGAKREPVMPWLVIQSYYVEGNYIYYPTAGLVDVRAGQVWRLVTPIFLHFGPIHLLFNLIMLYQLGSIVEQRRGWWRYVLLVLAIAVPSNIGQFWASGPSFGGMSGVIYGLFGYMWMKSRYEPEAGFYVSPNLVFWLIAWFVLCLVGVIGNVANTAHGVGLAVGMVIGVARPVIRRVLKR